MNIYSIGCVCELNVFLSTWISYIGFLSDVPWTCMTGELAERKEVNQI